MSSDFVGALTNFQTNGAEPLALSPQSIGNWLHNFLYLVWRGSRRGIEVNQAEVERIAMGDRR